MSAGPVCPRGLPRREAPHSRESPPMPEAYRPGDNYPSLLSPSAERAPPENASPLPSPADLLPQHSPDSSTSPRARPPRPAPAAGSKEGGKEGGAPARRQKSRTVFSQTQLCVLNDRFQRQKYLSLQQMQELSSLLDLSYKQVKTWFQNQRMKSKRWQKGGWPKAAGSQHLAAPAECPGLYAYHQGCLMTAPESLPVWGGQAWGGQPWGGQPWDPPAWTPPFPSCGEDPLPPLPQLQHSVSFSDLEATLEICGEAPSMTQPPAKYFSAQQVADLFPGCPLSVQSEDA